LAGRKKNSKTKPKPRVALDLTFGPNLRRCRRAAGYTQEELAFRAGGHATTVGLLERGERNPGFEVELYKGASWVPPTIGSQGRYDYEEPGLE
jgi:DNA-binding XRE family transcriptional regulator